jgi:hypothetical protein
VRQAYRLAAERPTLPPIVHARIGKGGHS